MNQDFVLYDRVKTLEKSVDSLTRELYNLRQQQSDMLEQIKRLKETKAKGDV